MANHSCNVSSSNSTQNHMNKPISSFLSSPRIFNGFLARSLSDIQTNKTSRDWLYDTEVVSPNSTLDGMQNLNIGNPLGYDRKSPNSITKKPPNNKLELGIAMSQFQTSQNRLYHDKYMVSSNSTLEGMQNRTLRSPFGGYDRKSSNPITIKPPSNKLESETVTPQFQTSQNRLYHTECMVSPKSILDVLQNHTLRNPLGGYDRKSPNSITKKPPSNKLESEIKFQISQNRLYHAECMVSPKSILDGMQNHTLRNPFGYDIKPPNPITKKHSNNKMESESIGLALIDPRVTSEKSYVLFGAKLKVEIPCSIVEVKNSTFGDFDEMETSEDYTCVITHGPNPKTTHIFDNCIIESCFGVTKLREKSCKVDHTEDKGI